MEDSITPGTGRSGGAVDLDNPGPGQGAELSCAYAIEFTADALAKQCAETKDAEDERKHMKSVVVAYYKRLATELDPMRKSSVPIS